MGVRSCRRPPPRAPRGSGKTATLVASLLGLQSSPNHADPLLRPSQRTRECHPCARTEVLPMFPVAQGVGVFLVMNVVRRLGTGGSMRSGVGPVAGVAQLGGGCS